MSNLLKALLNITGIACILPILIFIVISYATVILDVIERADFWRKLNKFNNGKKGKK